MYEDPNCTDCRLHSQCKTVCLPSLGDKTCKLAIFLDHPAYVEDKRGRSWVGDNAEFVLWCLRRMGVNPSLVYRDYIVKCYPTKKMPGKKADRMEIVRSCAQYRFGSLEDFTDLRALVVLGSLGCESITLDTSIGDKAGTKWAPISPVMRQMIPEVWVGYSPGIVKEKPAEAGSIYRVIWRAAEEAGLSPVTTKIKPYDFDK